MFYYRFHFKIGSIDRHDNFNFNEQTKYGKSVKCLVCLEKFKPLKEHNIETIYQSGLYVIHNTDCTGLHFQTGKNLYFILDPNLYTHANTINTNKNTRSIQRTQTPSRLWPLTLTCDVWLWPQIKVKKTYVIICHSLYCTLVLGMMYVIETVCKL